MPDAVCGRGRRASLVTTFTLRPVAGDSIEVQSIVVTQSDPVAFLIAAYTHDVLHDPELELVEIAVDAGAEQRLELVGTILNLLSGGILG